MFGDTDWVDFGPMKQKIDEWPEESRIELDILKDSSHQCLLDAPGQILEVIKRHYEKWSGKENGL